MTWEKKLMKGIGKTLALAAAIGAVGAPLSSAHAWWGGPWSSGGGPGYGLGDMFGLGDMDFGDMERSGAGAALGARRPFSANQDTA